MFNSNCHLCILIPFRKTIKPPKHLQTLTITLKYRTIRYLVTWHAVRLETVRKLFRSITVNYRSNLTVKVISETLGRMRKIIVRGTVINSYRLRQIFVFLIHHHLKIFDIKSIYLSDSLINERTTRSLVYAQI